MYCRNARKEIEADTVKPVITSKNATELNQAVVDLIEGITENEERFSKFNIIVCR